VVIEMPIGIYERKKLTIEEKFWNKVGKRDDCWMWIGSISGNGYGSISVNEKTMRAHRFSWELHNGPIPHGMNVLHKCDVRSCVNPSHLFIGSQQDNMDDMVAKGRCIRANGERQHLSKLNENQVRLIRRIRSEGKLTNENIGKMFNVRKETIREIVNGRTWKHLL